MDGDKKLDDDKVTARNRKEPPTPIYDPPAAKKPCRSQSDVIGDRISSLKEEYESIRLPFDDNDDDSTTITTHRPTLDKISVVITDEDYPSNINATHKLNEHDIQLVADADTPLIPYTQEMERTYKAIEATKEKVKSLLRTVVDSGYTAYIPAVGDIFERVIDTSKRFNAFITAVKHKISVVESVRKQAKRLMEACIDFNDIHMTSSCLKWGKLSTKATALLQLVEEERTKQTSMAATSKTKAKTPSTQEKQDESEKNLYIPYAAFQRRLNGGARKSHPPIQDQSLVWEDGKVFCMCCNYERIRYDKNVYRHTTSPGHIENLKWTTSRTAAKATAEAEADSECSIELAESANDERKVTKIRTTAQTQDEPDESEKNLYIPYAAFQRRLNGGARKSHPPIHDQSLVWEDGKIYCMCCNHERIKYDKNVFRHTTSPGHIEHLKWTTSRTAANSKAASAESDSECSIELAESANDERKVTKISTTAQTQDEPDESEKNLYIPYAAFQRRLNGGARKSHPPIHDQSLVWEDGKIYCMCCNHERIRHDKNVYRHTTSPGHIKNLNWARSNEVALLQQV